MKSVLYVFLLILFPLTGISQMFYPKQKEASAIKRLPLYVVLEEENPQIVKKLSKKNPEMLKRYKADVEGYNQNILAVVNENWTFSQKVEFKKWSEIESKVKKAKKGSFAFLRYSKYDYSMKWSMFEDGWKFDYQRIDRYTESSMTTSRLEIWLAGDRMPVHQTILPNIFPRPGELTFGVLEMQNTLEAALKGKDRKAAMNTLKAQNAKLKDKVLLLDETQLEEGMTEAEIRKYYPYEFKVVSYEEIEAAILSKDDQYAYVLLLPIMSQGGGMGISFAAKNFIHLVVDPKDGQYLGYAAPKAALGGVSFGRKIKAKQLEQYHSLAGK